MKLFIWKRKTWKWIGFSVFTLLFILGVMVAYLWTTYLYIPNPTTSVQFESLGDTISGDLIVPDDKSGPFPAVILLHGSGRETRDEEAFPTQAKSFFEGGICCLDI